MNFGKHLTLDCFEGEELDNENTIEKFLDELPSKINMTKISEPKIINYDANINEESGITGFVLIAESHISIHTYPKKNYAAIDVFSCKGFDEGKIVNYVKEKFKFKKVIKQLLERGYERFKTN